MDVLLLGRKYISRSHLQILLAWQTARAGDGAVEALLAQSLTSLADGWCLRGALRFCKGAVCAGSSPGEAR